MVAIDTTFLVDLYWQESPRHNNVVQLMEKWLSENTKIHIYYYCFNEFVHVISDSRRFENCYSVEEAIAIIDIWREMSNIKILYPEEDSFVRTLSWMSVYKLGRNRLNDTAMASCYANAGISKIVTANPKDFEVFKVFSVVDYRTL